MQGSQRCVDLKVCSNAEYTWQRTQSGSIKLCTGISELMHLQELPGAGLPAVCGPLKVKSDGEGLGGPLGMELGGKEQCQHRCQEQAAEGSEEIPSG